MTSHARFSIIPGWIVTDPRLKGRDLQVLCVLGRHTDRAGWCRRSQVKMAEEISCARSTVQASIDRLAEVGVVEKHSVESNDGRDSAHWYRVIFDRPPPAGYAFGAWGGQEDEEESPISGMPDEADSGTPPADISAPPAGSGSAPPAGPGSAPINDPSLTPPAEPEREGAQARDADQAGHDKKRSLLKRVKAMEMGRHSNPWPGAVGSSTTWAVQQMEKLEPEMQDLAEARRDDYLAICEAQGVKPVALGVYLRDHKFLDVTPQAAKAAAAKISRVPIRPFGPVWAGMRALALAKGPGQVDMPGDVRHDAECIHAALRKMSEQRAQSYRDRKGLELNDRGELIFPDDFEQAEYRRRQTDEGFPLVNHLHKLAQERSNEMTDGRNQLLADLCEAVPVGSEAYEAWRAYHLDRGLPIWPDPGQMKVVYFPKGGPEGMAEFMEAAKAAMAGAEGGRGDADAA